MTGQPQAAIDALERALQLDPTNEHATLLLKQASESQNSRK